MSEQANAINGLIQKGLGIHAVMDAAQPNAFTWATVELVLALDRLGVRVSIPGVPAVHPSIPSGKADVLRRLMNRSPETAFHIKWSHYWPYHMQTPLYGDVNAEIMCTNYRYAPGAKPLDPWMRHVQCNTYRKVAVSTFNQGALADIGFEPEACPVIPLGYSPEIETLFPNGRPLKRDPAAFHVLLVTNSNDLYRYGTDIALKTMVAAFNNNSQVTLHIKDYGASANPSLLQTWLKDYPSLNVVWHNEFLEKEALLKLYASMDLLLAPFRGEGFSMKILDAMAIGLPVIMPRFGGPADFAFDGAFLPVRFTEVPVGPCFDREHHRLGDNIYWCEPAAEHLTTGLREAFERRETLPEIGRAARQHVLGRFSWEHIAHQWAQVLLNWEQERQKTIAVSTKATRPLTVLIPTKDRTETLSLALEGYARQTLPASEFELLLVNDHGDFQSLEKAVGAFKTLPIRLLDNPGDPGPAAARNLGIRRAVGEIILITGDDVIPAPDFLERHVQAHRKYPDEPVAFLGKNPWHPDVPTTVFHDIIVGDGGHQFNYQGLTPMGPVEWGRFYTSNVSLKRAFLSRQEFLFNMQFPYAAFEDIEFAYRLSLQGMELRYLPEAIGYHLHPVTPESFVERQKKAGRMLVLFAQIQPSTPLARENQPLFDSLEERRERNDWPDGSYGANEALIQSLLGEYLRIIQWLENHREPSSADKRWVEWLTREHRQVWETINELALRAGMAHGWAENAEEAERATAWLTMLSLPRVTGPGAGYGAMLHENRPVSPAPVAGPVVFRNSPFIYYLSHALRTCPVLGRFVCAWEKAGPVKGLKARLGK